MLDISSITVKTEKEDHENSQTSGSQNSSYSDTNIEEALDELETKVMKLFEFVIYDISTLKKTSRKRQIKRESNKESITDDKWLRRVYIGNISRLTTIDDIRYYFSKCCGEIVNAYFFRTSKKSKHAFVEFKNRSSVEEALNQPHYLGDRNLTIGPAAYNHDDHEMNTKNGISKAKGKDSKILRYRPY